jgi:hypothetical protein
MPALEDRVSALAEEVVLGPEAHKLSLAEKAGNLRLTAERERLTARLAEITTELLQPRPGAGPVDLVREPFVELRNETLPDWTSPFLAVDEKDLLRSTGRRLYRELLVSMKGHYHLAEPWGYALSALFVIQSKLAPLLPSVFYLFIVGTKGTGKTTQMDHLSRLTGALRCQGISAAALRRSMKDGRTVALDQYDDIKEPEKRATMDALAEMGYTRGAPYICCDERNQPVEMPTFGPKILVFRGSVRDSLQDRGFTIPAAKSRELESVYKAMWPKWADLPARLGAWGAKVCATHRDSDMEALARTPEFLRKLRAISSVLEGRDAQLLITALLVAELAGVDLEAELRRAMEIRHAEEAISSDEDLDDLSQALLELAGTQKKLETGEFYVVTRSTIKKALDKRRGHRRLPPSKKSEFDSWLRDMGVRDEWVRPGHRKQYWVHLPVEFISGLDGGEVDGTPPAPPNPPGPSDEAGGAGGVGGAPPKPDSRPQAQVRADARASFDQAMREEQVET